ncbi:MAG: class I SAM-dependent methyltransferase [bacterium]
MTWYRQAFGAFYLLLYQHRDVAEAERCVSTVLRLVPFGEGPVLDLGCGDGRHLVTLTGQGMPAVGLDLSPELLTAANRRRLAGELVSPLVRADMRTLPLANHAVTGVLSLFTAFGYFGGLADHAGLVSEITRVLRPPGYWVLDYLNCDQVRQAGASLDRLDSERRVGPLRFRESKQLAADPERVVKSVQVTPLPGQEPAAAEWGVPATGLTYSEEVALFSLDAMDALAADHGLKRIATVGDYDGRPLVADSPRWLLVYQK